MDSTKPIPNEPIDFFHLLFDEEMLKNVLQYTNAKALQLAHNKPQNRRSPLQNFNKVSYPEFCKFLGLCILMGNVQMPSLKHYWSQKSYIYKHPIFGQTVSRNRFEVILRALSIYDINNKDITKKKIAYIIQKCIENLKPIIRQRNSCQLTKLYSVLKEDCPINSTFLLSKAVLESNCMSCHVQKATY